MGVRTCHIGAVGAALAAMLGCIDTPFETVCTDDLRAGLVVTVRDSVTGAPVSGARVVARTGATADTARSPLNGISALAYEKAGTYEVTVEQAGYRPWTRANVQVTRDECHVRTVSLTALLQPQP